MTLLVVRPDYDAGHLDLIIHTGKGFLCYWPAPQSTLPLYLVIHSRDVEAVEKVTEHLTTYDNGPAHKQLVWFY